MTTAKGGSGPARWSPASFVVYVRLRVIRSGELLVTMFDVRTKTTFHRRLELMLSPLRLRLYTQAYK